MKTIKQTAFQGDIMLSRVDQLPEGCTEVPAENGRHVLAHSETGHNHDCDAFGIRMFQSPDPMTCYLVMETVHQADIIHHRDFDTHETLRLLGGGPDSVWRIRRQREHTPEGWRRIED